MGCPPYSFPAKRLSTEQMIPPDHRLYIQLGFFDINEMFLLFGLTERLNNKRRRMTCLLPKAPRNQPPESLLPVNYQYIVPFDPLNHHCTWFHHHAAYTARTAMAVSFDGINLKECKPSGIDFYQPEVATNAADASDDFGGHVCDLNFQEGDKVGHLTFGYYENEHGERNSKKGKTGNERYHRYGLVSCERRNGKTLEHFTNSVHGMADLELPWLWERPRVDAMVAADTLPHTDTFRGCSINGYVAHDDGAVIKLLSFPEFKTSVVTYKGRHMIPFMYDTAGDTIAMIGFGEGGVKAEVKQFNASVVNELEPVGRLRHIAVGVKRGMVLTMPFLQTKGEPKAFDTVDSFVCKDLLWLVKTARRKCNCYDRAWLNKQMVTVYSIGQVRHAFYAFLGWRYIHWFEGDVHARRTHIFDRICKENIGGANDNPKVVPSRESLNVTIGEVVEQEGSKPAAHSGDALAVVRTTFVCSICAETYNQGPTEENDHTDRRPAIMPGSCGRLICMSCAENDRASQIEGLGGNRKMIKCMFCKEPYHSEKHAFYPNRDLMSVMAELP
eukprot:CAMPEP_0178630070 /NCGR_PEP_ID=MMETSP0698-20121128/10298_1 /TAXON_ID=265572 /ORGANISM="Extubocellulus spinifer, Strain CCMP396" /LENGTH=555 /DNA_ID=CAMNT_0020269441 /DNA_START=20 /DNA_END=1683 /DNA_ORIENTATION=-